MTTKIVWIYWHQGWDAAPDLVKRCRNSWIRLNPDYEVRALDQESLFDCVTFPNGIHLRRRDLTVQKIAALARLALLCRYGGVWTDATVICARPLDEWLDQYFDTHFFAFRNPGADRLMSNWFIAAEPDCVLIHRLQDSFFEFYASNYFYNQGTVWGQALTKYLTRRWSVNVEATLNWHSWFVRKVLRVYPYFIFHYTFNKLILTDPECEALWSRARPFSAEPAHRLQNLQACSTGVDDAKREIDSRLVPMFKLDWRVDGSSDYWAAVLQHLERPL